jgi:hypothetical protein
VHKPQGGDIMAEEKKGHLKITLEVDINEPLMEVIKENMKNMPQMMQMWQMRREERAKSS